MCLACDGHVTCCVQPRCEKLFGKGRGRGEKEARGKGRTLLPAKIRTLHWYAYQINTLAFSQSSLNFSHNPSLFRAGATGAAGTAMAVLVLDRKGAWSLGRELMCIQPPLVASWVSIAVSIIIVCLGKSLDRNGDYGTAQVHKIVKIMILKIMCLSHMPDNGRTTREYLAAALLSTHFLSFQISSTFPLNDPSLFFFIPHSGCTSSSGSLPS